MLIFSCTLRSDTSIKTSFALGSDTVSGGFTCGGLVLNIVLVSAIFNNEFLVGSLSSDKIEVVEGGSLNSVTLLFADCFKNLPI